MLEMLGTFSTKMTCSPSISDCTFSPPFLFVMHLLCALTGLSFVLKAVVQPLLKLSTFDLNSPRQEASDFFRWLFFGFKLYFLLQDFKRTMFIS